MRVWTFNSHNGKKISNIWVHLWLGCYNKNHDTHLSCVLSPKARIWQNKNIILNNEMGYVFLGFQPINVVMNDSNQLNKF
jgi:hypothetical protein